jgi:alpha-beta hydrolase superfamily lysophospholipase
MRRGSRDREALVFTAASAVGLLHGLDDAFVHRGPGLGFGQHALAGAIAIVAWVAGVLVFPRLRPGLRAALAFAYGGLALTNGALHAIHVAGFGVDGGDVTGAVAAAAGVVLLALAAAIPWRHRGTGRWTARVLAPLGLVVGVIFVLAPIGMGIVASHKWREPVGRVPDASYADVAFRASDGLRLHGWYRASRNGAAVVVVHGGSSDRRGAVRHARMLARHGYGVLVYDARGRGESDGMENNYGWDWPKDVAGALAFLKGRADVDPRRIGAVGLSTGADVLVEVAAKRRDLAALVTDGAAAASFADAQRLRGSSVETAPGWLMFATLRVTSGDRPGPPLEQLVRRLRTPTLMISAGTAIERDYNVHYERAANGRVEHWNLPRADHTRAIRQEPAAYERRVVGFLDAALRR